MRSTARAPAGPRTGEQAGYRENSSVVQRVGRVGTDPVEELEERHRNKQDRRHRQYRLPRPSVLALRTPALAEREQVETHGWHQHDQETLEMAPLAMAGLTREQQHGADGE
jgi:hypothetical protein